jgi:hypothetical protein
MERHIPMAGATEREALQYFLDVNRDALVWKLHGLTEEQARWSPVPSGTSLLGLVKHAAWVEYDWFQLSFGRPIPEDETTELDRYGWEPLPEDTIESVLGLYAEARAASDAAVDELGLDAVGRDEPEPDPVDMRWIMGHMIEETARHAGHADIIRELLDGTTGYYPPDPA